MTDKILNMIIQSLLKRAVNCNSDTIEFTAKIDGIDIQVKASNLQIRVGNEE